MADNSFGWLHLTDLHFGLNGQDCLWPNLRQPFLDGLGELHECCGPWDAVLFTGDLVQSGNPEQFQAMQQGFLDPLWERLHELGSGEAKLLAVPGNHDLLRPDHKADNPAADTLLSEGGFARVGDRFWAERACSYRGVIDEAFVPYLDWWRSVTHRPDNITSGALPGDFAVTLSAAERSIGVIGLNTAFLQLGTGDYRERLVWNARQLLALFPAGVDRWLADHDQCLLLTHHGTDWLTPDARSHGETEIAPAGRFAAHIFGHMHETEIRHIRRGGGDKAARLLQGCSLFGMEKRGDPPTVERAHGYSAGRIMFDEDGAVLRLWPRMATSRTGPWRYIPDHEHAELESDEGTVPDRLHAARRIRPSNDTTRRPSWPEALGDLDWPVADHGHVRDAFAELLTAGAPSRYLPVHGLSMTGKTHITDQMLANALPLPWLACGRLNFKGTTNLEEREVGPFVQHLDIEPPPAGTRLNDCLAHILNRLIHRARPTLLIFDTYEQVGEARHWVEKQLLPSLVRATWLRVVIAGQQVPESSGTVWTSVAHAALELRLPPEADWLEFGRRFRPDLTLEKVRTVYELTFDRADLLSQVLKPRR